MKAGIPAGDGLAGRLAAVAGSGKLASIGLSRHKQPMRSLIPAAMLFVAACAPRPAVTPTPQPAESIPAPTSASQHDHRTINGMTTGEVIQLFGKPRLQIVEGEGTKLQFSGANCVLDVYFYPPAGRSGPARATHFKARNLQGGELNAQSCVASIQNR